VKMLIWRIALAVLALAVGGLGVSAVPAAAGDLVITDKDQGKTFTAKVGQKISVNLRNPGGGGYSFLAPEFDKTILKMVGEKPIPRSDPRRMGDFGRMVFEFQAIKAGQTALVFPIKRPWEKASETFLRVTISVLP
jgi:predicted secreted protein